MGFFAGIGLLGLALPARAGSIEAPATIGSPDSGAATPDAAAPFYNPAAMGGADGFHSMLDVTAAKVHIDVDATRREGIDPNTGEAYATSRADVVVPVFLLGASGEIVKDRVSLGIAVTDNFVGGGKYAEDDPPPYKASTRYGGIDVTLLSVAIMPSAAITLVDGLHVGGGAGYVLDHISAVQASDPLGGEGKVSGPYDADVILHGVGNGGHAIGYGGVFFDKLEVLQVGASFTSGGTFKAAGTADLDAPAFLSASGEPTTVHGVVSFDQPMPPIVRAYLASQINEKLRVTAGIDAHLWGACCGTSDGDLHINVLSEDGDEIGSEDGIALNVAQDIYSPRRVRNAVSVAAAGGYQVTDHLWLGLRLGYNPHAVPDYAVSSTNLDFDNLGGVVGARYEVGPVTFGLAFQKYFLLTRTITTSAWDVRDTDDPSYVDDRFSAKNPYSANTNGTYAGSMNALSIRVQVDLPRAKRPKELPDRPKEPAERPATPPPPSAPPPPPTEQPPLPTPPPPPPPPSPEPGPPPPGTPPTP